MAFCLVIELRILTSGTDAEEFQLVSDCLKAVAGRDPLLEFAHRAFIDFDHFRAAGADQVMMMAVIAFLEQFETSRTVAEIKFLHHSHLLE